MLCLILEMSSGDFFITCFGIGALCALVASVLCAPFWLQVIVFALFSVLSIYFLRPRLVTLLHRSERGIVLAETLHDFSLTLRDDNYCHLHEDNGEHYECDEEDSHEFHMFNY